MNDISDVCRAVGSQNAAQLITQNERVLRPTGLNGASRTAAYQNGASHMTADQSGLPPIKSARSLIESNLALPAEVVHGLLHRGSKMVLGGGSKCYKTYCLADLALAVANGLPWWGLPTTAGRVLYINFEIQEPFFAKRLDYISSARGMPMCALDNIDVWTLRGHCADLSTLMPPIIEQVKKQTYDLIIIDPIYKGMGSRDENSAGDINSMLNEIERLAVQTGAAVVFGAHFSKGNQAGKESIDRISGSGVFARDPDSILVMTKHENENTYTVEATLRNFKPIEPFCLRWEHPLMERDDNVDPADLKRPGNKLKKFTPIQLIEVLGYQTLTTKEWETQTCLHTKMSPRTFADKKKELVEGECPQVVPVEGNKWAVAQNLRIIQGRTEHVEATGGAEVQ